MSTTIHYEGIISSKDKINKVINAVEEFSKTLNWNTERYEKDGLSGIVVFPNDKSEALTLIFDKNLSISSFTKTANAPIDIHYSIIKLLYSIKKYFEKLTVLDEAGIWDEYISTIKKSTSDNTLSLTELSKTQIKELEEGFITKEDLDAEGEWFWKSNDSYDVLNFPLIRDLMRKDLSSNKSSMITLSEVIELSVDKTMPESLYPNALEIALIILVEAWVSTTTVNDLKPIKFSVLGWLISHGCFGFNGGYLNDFHRKAEKLFHKLIEETEDTLNPEVTLKVFYAILDYFKVMRIHDDNTSV